MPPAMTTSPLVSDVTPVAVVVTLDGFDGLDEDAPWKLHDTQFSVTLTMFWVVPPGLLT